MAGHRARALALVALAVSIALAGAYEVRYKVLTDENFESVTQAASGQTSGAWLVLLGPKHDFDAMRPFWDDLARHTMPMQVFLGKVDLDANPGLRHRFHIHRANTVLLFRHGKMYRWHGRIHDTGPIFRWATESYVNSVPEDVPPELGLIHYVARVLDRFLTTRIAEVIMALAVGIAVVILIYRDKRDVRERAPMRARLDPTRDD